MKRTLCLLALLALSGLDAAAGVLAVYHTSDVHGWYFSRPALWDDQYPSRAIGGFPAFAALLAKETTPYILLDSGDMFQGTPEGILTKGRASIVLMNQLGYAAAAPGNHDYDYGEDRLAVMASSAAFPILAANVYLKDGGARPAYLRPYTIIEKAGKKIAILGLAGKHTATSTRPANVKHLDFRDEAEEAARLLPEILAQVPDAVIALTHLGLEESMSLKRLDISTWTFAGTPPGTLRIVRGAPGINALFGGHNHVALLKGYLDPVSGAWLGESGYGLSYVTRAELAFDDVTGRLKGVTGGIVPLWVDRTGEDAAVLKTVAGFSADVEREMGAVVGSAGNDLDFSPDWLDSPIGNLVCDLTREAAGTELAFHNTRAIRAEIKKGKVKLRDLYQALPFDNNIITMRLDGAQLKRLMADNLLDGSVLMQVSGLEVEFRDGPGGAPADIRLLRGGAEIKPGEEFTVATNDYLAFGGNGGGAFAGGREIKNTMIQMRDLVRKAFETGPVKAPPAGRIRRLK
ncbi:MAG: bifunctional metallophosphatase/5'-nucleotidase [Elusimicrobia bacterium]|nr:bifunctional metallophosphatase/5'-nucleotidase [Elusimicrobiota bacterium]